MLQANRVIALLVAVWVSGCAGSAEWERGPHDLAIVAGSQGQISLSFTAEGSYADTYTFSATVDDADSGLTASVSPAEAEVDGDPVAVTLTVTAAATATGSSIKVRATDSDGEVPSMTSVFVTVAQP